MSKRNLIGKALQILRLMLDSQSSTWGVREMARVSGLPPTTVHRLLSLLQGQGLVYREPETGRYRVGLELYRIAWKAEVHFPIRGIALRHMRELVDCCNETVLLGLYSSVRMEMIFAAVVESRHSLRYVIPLNVWIPVYTSASGLAIMAFLPKSERELIIERTGLAPLTEHSITAPDVLEREVARIRTQGYCCTHGQRTPGAVGIAAPVFWGVNGRIVGDILVTIPEQRYDKREEPELIRLVCQHARRITEQIGNQMPVQTETGKL